MFFIGRTWEDWQPFLQLHYKSFARVTWQTGTDLPGASYTQSQDDKGVNKHWLVSIKMASSLCKGVRLAIWGKKDSACPQLIHVACIARADLRFVQEDHKFLPRRCVSWDTQLIITTAFRHAEIYAVSEGGKRRMTWVSWAQHWYENPCDDMNILKERLPEEDPALSLMVTAVENVADSVECCREVGKWRGRVFNIQIIMYLCSLPRSEWSVCSLVS